MLKTKYMLFGTCMLAFAAQSQAVDVGPSCKMNCVSAQKLGSSLIYVWHSENGDALKTFYVDLPHHAVEVPLVTSETKRRFTDASGNAADPVSAEFRPEYMTHAYENEAEMIVVNIIKIYDKKGMLVSVSETTSRLAKGKSGSVQS